MIIVKLFHFCYMTIFISNTSKTNFGTKCLKHFKKLKTLQQYRWYYNNKIDPDNLIN